MRRSSLTALVAGILACSPASVALVEGDGETKRDGLLPAEPKVIPPSTMTRQQRRAAERAYFKRIGRNK